MPEDRGPDYRYSLANERTFLAWLRTGLALVGGGVLAAKALEWDHELLRWLVALPPIVFGVAIAVEASMRWRVYETAIEDDRRLPVGRGLKAVAAAVALYAALVLIAVIVD